MSIVLKKSLGELLLENGIVNKEAIDEVIQNQTKTGKKFGKILREKGYIDDNVLYSFLETQMGVKFKKKIDIQPNEKIFQSLPIKYCRNKGIAPVKMTHKSVKVFISEPMNTSMVNEISFMTGKVVKIDFATDSAIMEYLDIASGNAPSITATIKEEYFTSQEDKKEDLSEDDSPVVRFVEEALQNGIDRNASDIHFETYEKKAALRLRIDGGLHQTDDIDLRMYPAIISRIKILSELDISEKRLPQDGRIMMNYMDRKIDIRVSILPTIYGENAVLRILDKGKKVLSLDDIGLLKDMNIAVKKESRKPNGMILITGPTGSGKTTTLYAILQYIMQFENKILTIEDPVEYQMDGISQVQVHSEIGLTFAHGLRAFLRHDPDIIMIGEIRDVETAEIAIRAALTGHLVLSTLHTNDSASTLTRFIDMGIPSYLLTSTVNIILAQRLVRKICPDCKTYKKLTKDDIELFGIFDSFKPGDKVYHGKGCIKCGKTGYLGRIPIFEMLKINDNIKNAVLKGMSSFEIKDLAQKEGMWTLRTSGLYLVKNGITAIEEVEKITSLGEL